MKHFFEDVALFPLLPCLPLEPVCTAVCSPGPIKQKHSLSWNHASDFYPSKLLITWTGMKREAEQRHDIY